MSQPDTLTLAIKTAADFNREHGAEFLAVNKSLCRAAVIAPNDVAQLRKDVNGWFTAKALFEHVHHRRPTHGELVNLGRQLAKAFPAQRVGPTGYYFVAPEGTPVRPR